MLLLYMCTLGWSNGSLISTLLLYSPFSMYDFLYLIPYVMAYMLFI